MPRQEESATTFILVRHGQTAWNREQVFRGRADVPLSEEGRAQARATARALASVPLAAVYASPLSRARETAAFIAAAHGLTPIEEPALIDLSFGTWEGKSLVEVTRLFPELYRQWQDQPHTVTFPGGEDLSAVRKRVEELLTRLVTRHLSETVCLVSHRVVNKVMLLSVLDLGNEHFWRLEQDTCCLNRFRYQDGRYIISRLNDTCHLRPPAQDSAPDF